MQYELSSLQSSPQWGASVFNKTFNSISHTRIKPGNLRVKNSQVSTLCAPYRTHWRSENSMKQLWRFVQFDMTSVECFFFFGFLFNESQLKVLTVYASLLMQNGFTVCGYDIYTVCNCRQSLAQLPSMTTKERQTLHCIDLKCSSVSIHWADGRITVRSRKVSTPVKFQSEWKSL